MQHAGLAGVDGVPHVPDVDVGRRLPEFLPPVPLFFREAGLDFRFRLPGGLPYFQVDLRASLEADGPSGLGLFLLDPLLDLFRDLAVTAAECLDEFGGYPVHLVDDGFGSLFVDLGGPGPSESLGEQVLEEVLVDFGDLDHAGVQFPAVERGPYPVRASAHAVGYGDVLVRLRVAVTGVEMVEHESGDAVACHGCDPSLPRPRRSVFVFEVGDGHVRGFLEAFVDAPACFRVAERP